MENNNGTWNSVVREMGRVNNHFHISKSDIWVWIVPFFFIYRDLILKEVELRSLLDMLSLMYLGYGASKERRLAGSWICGLELQTYI